MFTGTTHTVTTQKQHPVPTKVSVSETEIHSSHVCVSFSLCPNSIECVCVCVCVFVGVLFLLRLCVCVCVCVCLCVCVCVCVYVSMCVCLCVHMCECVYVYVCVCICMYVCVCVCVCVYRGTVAQLLALLALQPHSKKVMGSIPAWGAVGSGGQVLPRPSVLRGSVSRAFLCGVCMFSPCSQGVSSTKNPNRKNMQNNKLPTAPGGSLRKDSPGWEKAENKFTATSGLPACVCVLCRLENEEHTSELQ